MKRKIGIAIVLTAAAVTVLLSLSKSPIVSCNMEVPEIYMEAIKDQAKGSYSKRLPLVPVYVSIDAYSEGTLYYTIHYFPFGTVGMSYSKEHGYNQEKPLTNM